MNSASLRTLTLAALSLTLFCGADWTRFRGENGSGVSDDQDVPTTWSATENVVWKTALPGYGSSSPITLGEKIFLTCYSGYGFDEKEPGDQKNLRLHLLCLERASGKIVWDRQIEPRFPERDYDTGYLSDHGYASASPVTDGKAAAASVICSRVLAFALGG